MKFARSGGFRRNGIHVLVRRTAAHAPALAVLDNGGAAGGAVDARAGAVLCSASRPPPAGAGDRPRIPVRHRIRSAACVLARRDCIPPGRYHRRLFPVAALHRAGVRGGVRARPRHRRRAAGRDGGDADGRHRGVLGADAGVRPGDSRNAAVGADPAALLDGRDAGRVDHLGRAWRRGGASPAHQLYRADPARASRGLHGGNRVRPRPGRDGRPVGCRRRDDRGAVSVSDLARSEHRHPLPRSRNHRRQSPGLSWRCC